MEVPGHESEAGLLARLVSRLPHRAVLAAGSGRDALADAMLSAGVRELHLLEIDAMDVDSLRGRFRDDQRVEVHGPVAVRWDAIAELSRRGELPRHAGLLHLGRPEQAAALARDLAASSPIGDLECDILVLGVAGEGATAATATRAPDLRLYGFTHAAFLERRDGGAVVHWDGEEIPRGSSGLLVFLHATVLGRTIPVLLEYTLRAGPAEANAQAIADLRDAVARQAAAADERLEAIEELLSSIKQVSGERDLQARVATERLAVIEDLQRDRDVHAEAAAARLELIHELGAGSRRHRADLS